MILFDYFVFHQGIRFRRLEGESAVMSTLIADLYQQDGHCKVVAVHGYTFLHQEFQIPYKWINFEWGDFRGLDSKNLSWIYF